MKNYDLIAIGTGSAGSAAAYRCRKAGWKVAVVDNRPFGGTCALRGCDPKKVLVGASEIIDRAETMEKNGIKNGIKIEWPEMMKFKRTFTSPVPEKREKGFASAGIDAFHGHAAFAGRNTLRVGGEVLEAKHFLIATGAKPMKLGIAGEEHITISDQFLELDNLPENITFIGGGYISFELAHVAARAGAKVRIVHRSSPLKKFDPDLVSTLVKASEDAGIEIRLGLQVNSIERK
ncbi:MAG: NAD(P)/FAD-dependent oxidoreductase, partial [Candidatus Aenigmarchaeota archaeon]|nr:NAD(P)/FAD-dependent oxidoreductase [Candidatus Aenigmarchaeota archaeon]